MAFKLMWLSKINNISAFRKSIVNVKRKSHVKYVFEAGSHQTDNTTSSLLLTFCSRPTAQLITLTGISYNSLTLTGISYNSLTLTGISYNSLTLTGISYNSLTLTGISYNSLTLTGISYNSLTLTGISYNSLHINPN